MIIRSWVEAQFDNSKPKLFLELGSHRGEDTAWLAALPNVVMHTFEPDPRNHGPALPNVVAHQLAISDSSGSTSLLLSDKWGDKHWTCSSTICKPKTHLTRWPISFGPTILVQTISLDDFFEQQRLGPIDFIWCDIQGAEAKMIHGGREALCHTAYLYTEYSDQEEFEGQPNLEGLLKLLPTWKIVHQWPDDVLLKNHKLVLTTFSKE